MTTIKHGDSETFVLPALKTMTVAVPAYSRGRVTFLTMNDGAPATGWAALVPGATLVYGPWGSPRRYKIECYDHTISVTIGDADPVRGIGLPAGFVELSGTGAPDDAVQASLNVNPAGDDNALTVTAVEYGIAGNDISIEYLDPAANNAALSVSVTGKHISVRLATDGSGVITSTAAQVRTAILASAAAAALVSVAINTADTGTGDDGSGVVTALARANLASGAGTGVGVAGPGSRYTSDAGALYVNTGTQAAPVWATVTVS